MTTKDTNTKGVTEERPCALFHPGRLYMTHGVKARLDRKELSNTELLLFIGKHLCGDWGDLCPGDKAENEKALLSGARIFSTYRSEAGEKFFVITEQADMCGRRTVTTVLLADEY